MNKKILTIQDISSFGCSSASIAFSICSALGNEVICVPTIVLSNHNGISKKPVQANMDRYLEKTLSKFVEDNMKFDAIHVGYLANDKQIDTICKYLDNLKSDNCFVLVDPVLGENGKSFGNIKSNRVEKYHKLFLKADLITPNKTEAYMIINKEYDSLQNDDLIKYVCNFYGNMLIKSLRQNDEIFNYYKGQIFSYKYIENTFLGCGDIINSIIISLDGPINERILKATNFLNLCLKDSERSYGVEFEKHIEELTKLKAA